GGNRRYVQFKFGQTLERPRLTLVRREGRDAARPTLSVQMENVDRGDVGEMWLHVETGLDIWRRYPMSLLGSPGGVLGVTAMPSEIRDSRVSRRYYVSATTRMGEGYYTEITR